MLIHISVHAAAPAKKNRLIVDLAKSRLHNNHL
jgi:hypothetical protein